MEFDPDFKTLLSPDAIAAANATIEGAIIQADAARYAADKQYEASLLISVVTIASALVVIYSAKISSITNDNAHQRKIETAEAVIFGRLLMLTENIARSYPYINFSSTSLTTNPVGVIEYAYSSMKTKPHDFHPENIENCELLGGDVALHIDNVARKLRSIDELKEQAVKAINLNLYIKEKVNDEDNHIYDKKNKDIVDDFFKKYTNALKSLQNDAIHLLSMTSRKKRKSSLMKLKLKMQRSKIRSYIQN